MTKADLHRANPEDLAAQIMAEAPDPQWVRRLVDGLDRRVRTSPLERFMSLWQLSAAEAASAFGVSRQAFSKWLKSGPPAERATAIACLAAATETLHRHIKRERIPAVVRRPATQLKNRSLYDMVRQGRYAEMKKAVDEMFDLRRVQP